MPIPILMPALSPTMTSGKLAKWCIREGDKVESGDIIAEIETDKATMELEAIEEGIIGKLKVNAGTEEIAVNQEIAIILEHGETIDDINNIVSSREAIEPVKITSEISTSIKLENLEKRASTSKAREDNQRIYASPIAKRLATKAGLDISQIQGSGPHGRIIKNDIKQLLDQNNIIKYKNLKNPNIIDKNDSQILDFKEIPHSKMRKLIARRLTESKQQIPHFYLNIDCELDSLIDIRQRLNNKSKDDKITINDFIIRAAAIAVKKIPSINTLFTPTSTKCMGGIDISVAVALKEGLITPIIRNANEKGLLAISKEMKTLTQQAHQGSLSPEQYQGGTLTISNLGMYGINSFSAIINPPQSCILAIGAAEERPIVKNNQLSIATLITCTLSADHRVIDGALGAAFMSEFKALLEDPVCMIL